MRTGARVVVALLVAACGAQPNRTPDAATQQAADMTAVFDFTLPGDDAQPDLATATAPDLTTSTPTDLAGADLTVVPDLVVVDLAGADLNHPAQGAGIPFTQAYAGGNPVAGTVAAGVAVTVVTQTTPRGSAKTVAVHWTTKGDFKAEDNLVAESFDGAQPAPQYDQWYGVIPGQAKGTTVTWYVASTGYDGTTLYWSNFGANFSYAVQ